MASICTQNFKSKFALLKIESLILSIPLNTIENGTQALDDWTHFFFFFFFFLHFHPFGDPNDMFMQLFYLKNLFYQSSINPPLWATI